MWKFSPWGETFGIIILAFIFFCKTLVSFGCRTKEVCLPWCQASLWWSDSFRSQSSLILGSFVSLQSYLDCDPFPAFLILVDSSIPRIVLCRVLHCAVLTSWRDMRSFSVASFGHFCSSPPSCLFFYSVSVWAHLFTLWILFGGHTVCRHDQ